MPIDPTNPPDQVTIPEGAIPIRICGGTGYTPPPVPSNPPNQVTNDSAAIPVYFVPKPL